MEGRPNVKLFGSLELDPEKCVKFGLGGVISSKKIHEDHTLDVGPNFD